METLRIGAQGPYVSMLQLALMRSGFLNEEPDGIFGPRTQSAVLAFQRANNLTADGIVGARTWSALSPYLLGYILITVQRGDNFYRLAQRFGTSVDAISVANPGFDSSNLRIGSRLVVPLNFPVVPTNIPFTYTLLDFTVRGLKARYPFIETGSIGSSVMGKQLYYLRLGRGANQVFYNASHHANEWITTPVLMKFFEDYAEAVATGGSIFGAEADSLIRQTSLYIVPMVNPDGVDLVTGAMPRSSPYYMRALRISGNYPNIPFPSGWQANILGTDLNLQYPAGWEQAREIKFAEGFTSPAPESFVGTAPLSAPESAAVYQFTRANNFSIVLAYHTQGKVIFWKFLDIEPPFGRQIAEQFSSVSGYEVSETPYESSYAGYKDWFILQYNRPGYTIEAGQGVNPMPISQFDEIYRDNLGILTLGLTATT